MMAAHLLAVAVGGSLGAVARFLISSYVQRRVPAYPEAGTLLVNMAGCLLIGLAAGWLSRDPHLSPLWKSLLTVGFLGSFTTFSTFGAETLHLLQAQRLPTAVMHVAVHVVLGVVCVWLGYATIEK